MTRRSRIARFATSMSQMANVVVFNGNPDETISARVYREDRETARKIIDAIFFRDPDHCRKSHKVDVEHARALLAAGGARVANQPEGVLD